MWATSAQLPESMRFKRRRHVLPPLLSRLVRVYGACTRDRANVCLIMELMEVGELSSSCMGPHAAYA